jgi:hypothetical protein
MSWIREDEPTDENMIGMCAIDFTTNYGVPLAWTTPSADKDFQEEPA